MKNLGAYDKSACYSCYSRFGRTERTRLCNSMEVQQLKAWGRVSSFR